MTALGAKASEPACVLDPVHPDPPCSTYVATLRPIGRSTCYAYAVQGISVRRHCHLFGP